MFVKESVKFENWLLLTIVQLILIINMNNTLIAHSLFIKHHWYIVYYINYTVCTIYGKTFVAASNRSENGKW